MTAFENILITGANRGIGLEFVRQYLAQSPAPLNVIATSRSPSEALAQLQADNSNLHILTYDATDYAALPELVTSVGAIVGPRGLNLLVNNAACSGKEGTFASASLAEDTRALLENNAIAPLELTRQLLPLLRLAAGTESRKRCPLIVNISSKGGSIGDNTTGGMMPYRTSKAALNMLSRSAAMELKGEGIAVVALTPGWVRTDLGGPKAPTGVQESVQGMVEQIERTDLTRSGTFFNFKGEELPF